MQRALHRKQANESEANQMPTRRLILRTALVGSSVTPAAAAAPAATSADRPAAMSTTASNDDDAAEQTNPQLKKRTASVDLQQPPSSPDSVESDQSRKKARQVRSVTASPVPPGGPHAAVATTATFFVGAARSGQDDESKAKGEAQPKGRTTQLDVGGENSSRDRGKRLATSGASEPKQLSDGQKRRKATTANRKSFDSSTSLSLSFDSSDDDFGNNGDSAKPTVAPPRRYRSGRANWLSSLNNRNDGDRYIDGLTSSDEDDEGAGDIDDFDRKLASISRRRSWLSSPSRDDKLDHLLTIANDTDKILQLLLWDIGFEYKILPHQYDAVRAVAGFLPTFPCKPAGALLDDADSIDSDFSGKMSDIEEMLKLDDDGRSARASALRTAGSAEHRRHLMLSTRGLLLADEMGLGKTVEAIAGAALRNALDGKKKPTLIVSPQDGIQAQWHETLLKAGVEQARIKIIGEKGSAKKKRRGEHTKTVSGGEYILCTRYKIQSEMKRLFETSSATELQATHKNSFLFPNVPIGLIKKLRNQYRAEKGKERNQCIRRKEAKQDCVARLIRESFNSGKASLPIAFETIVIDEAHFLKNSLAYWGLGAGLLGAQAKRTVLLSGTPYNNGPSDMSALMTYIDPRHASASLRWWEKATEKGTKKAVVEAVSDWRKTFMLRRTKDILKNKLPDRERICINIGAVPSDLGIYEAYEAAFLDALKKLQEKMDEDSSPESRQRMKELFDIMMACMACMRMSLIHPILPGGREATIQFSPSRKHLLKREEKKKHCVLCSDAYPSSKAEQFVMKRESKVKGEQGVGESDRTLLGLGTHVRTEMDLDDDELDDEDGIDGEDDTASKKGPIVELGPEICQAHGSDCCHFGHTRCISLYLEKGCDGCPRCKDLASRIHPIESGNTNQASVSRKVCCQDTTTTVTDAKGFTVSTKMESAVKWFETTVPEDEKAIFLSFFKGSLDLIEGILTEKGIECVRYDGDVSKETRKRELERFKTGDSCRVLLASVQSGGTGLNITEANHVCFLDRWFNPTIHDQAESRVHRIGQTRDVKIAYLDTGYTVDTVMKLVNEMKEGNASVILADGTSLGDRWSIGYRNLAGVIGNTLKHLQLMRFEIIERNIARGNANAPLPAPDESQLETKAHEGISTRSAKKRSKVKEEDASSSTSKTDRMDASDNDDNDDNDGTSSSDLDQKPSALDLKTAFSPPDNERPCSSDDDDSVLNYGATFSAKSEKKTDMSENERQEISNMGGLSALRRTSTSSDDSALSEELSSYTCTGHNRWNSVKEDPDGPSRSFAPVRPTSVTKNGTSSQIIELLSDSSEDEEERERQITPRKRSKLFQAGVMTSSSDSNHNQKQKDNTIKVGDAEYQQALFASIKHGKDSGKKTESTESTISAAFDHNDDNPASKSDGRGIGTNEAALKEQIDKALDSRDFAKARDLMEQLEFQFK